VTRAEIDQVLASLAASATRIRDDERFADLFADGSAARRLARVVAHAQLWTGPEPPDVTHGRALAVALRQVWATYEDRRYPEDVDDAHVAAAVAAALEGAELPDPAHAPSRAIAAVGEALGAYHGSLELGVTARARDHVRERVAVALGYMLWTLRDVA
jgi:hypothetical protein